MIEARKRLCLSYVLFTQQLQVVSLRRAPDSPLSLQHLQLVGVSSLMAVHRCCKVHSELLHPDNILVWQWNINMATAATAELCNEQQWTANWLVVACNVQTWCWWKCSACKSKKQTILTDSMQVWGKTSLETITAGRHQKLQTAEKMIDAKLTKKDRSYPLYPL